MSKVFKGAISIVKNLFSPPKPPEVNIPDPVIPAAPAPTRREDTGAQIVLGSGGANKNQRVSGKGSSSSRGSLSNLGKGSGINI